MKVAVITEEAEYDTRVILQIGNKNAVINNRTVTNDVTPVIVDSRTMVPHSCCYGSVGRQCRLE